MEEKKKVSEKQTSEYYTTIRVAIHRRDYLEQLRIKKAASSVDDALLILINEVERHNPEWIDMTPFEKERRQALRITPSQLKQTMKEALRELSNEDLRWEGVIKG
jgi:hypothetical protein